MYEYKALVTRVIDGDTIDCRVDLGFDIWVNTRFRLYGIDTPESRTRNKAEKKRGLEVKAYVKDKIWNQIVTIKTHKKGKFGRYLVWVYEQGEKKCLNLDLIDTGRAKAYHGGKR